MSGYSPHEHRPLGAYAATMSVYGTGVGALSLLARRRGATLPARVPWSDLAAVAVATHKLARLVAKDPVTSPLRAPFTRFVGVSGPAELDEEVRGTGARKVVGELISCPLCLAQWIGTALCFGLLLAPRATRFVAGTFTVVAAADALQLAYGRLQPG